MLQASNRLTEQVAAGTLLSRPTRSTSAVHVSSPTSSQHTPRLLLRAATHRNHTLAPSELVPRYELGEPRSWPGRRTLVPFCGKVEMASLALGPSASSADKFQHLTCSNINYSTRTGEARSPDLVLSTQGCRWWTGESVSEQLSGHSYLPGSGFALTALQWGCARLVHAPSGAALSKRTLRLKSLLWDVIPAWVSTCQLHE